MKHRYFLVALMALAISGCSNTPEKKMNLLFIMTDQQRYDALSIAGNSVLETPNLDQLAREGVYFRNAYSQCAVCGPARSTILTGHTVEHTQVNTNGKTYYYEEEGLMAMPTFDEVLSANGYHCEYYGKWHSVTSHTAIYKNPKQASEKGNSVFAHGGQKHVYMDYLKEHVSKRELEPGELYDTFTDRPYETDPLDHYHGMDVKEFMAKKPKRVQPDLHGKLELPAEHSLTAFQARETIDAIKRLKDSTFSITCSFHFPHAPMVPPEPYYSMYPAEEMMAPVSIQDGMENSPYRGANGRMGMPQYADTDLIKYMISNYYGLVREIDDWVGEILATLDECGLRENTLVIFTSDHGEMLGAHGLREKNVFYEESAHIPLLLRFPGKIVEGKEVEDYVTHLDLFPTILDYLGMEELPSDGISLRDLVEESDSERKDYIVTEWDYRGDVESNYMVLKNGWKLIIPYSETSKVIDALYDLNTDPHEMTNLIGKNPNKADYADKAEELKACLVEWLKEKNSRHVEGVKARQLI